MAHIRNILVPLDGSPPSIAALAAAVDLAADTGASIDVLTVRAQDADEPEAQAAFAEASARLGDRVSRRIEAGDPIATILETAEAGKYDLLVMGTHGRVGRLRMLLGSVAEAVVRTASCPVLTVRVPSGPEESFSERIHRVRWSHDHSRVR